VLESLFRLAAPKSRKKRNNGGDTAQLTFHRMTARKASLVLASLVVAGFCTRLGFWQLERLDERRAFNAFLRQRLAARPVQLSALPTDTAKARFRSVSLTGKYDYANEIVLASRTRQGSPGVNIITPLRVAGRDTAVLVNRGWVYAPDGMTVEVVRWREGDSLDGTGHVETFPAARKGRAKSATNANAYRWLDRELLSQRLSYPVAPYYVVLASAPSAESPNVPPRLDPPSLDEGPHRSYAIQWFSFASISIIGMFLLTRRK